MWAGQAQACAGPLVHGDPPGTRPDVLPKRVLRCAADVGSADNTSGEVGE